MRTASLALSALLLAGACTTPAAPPPPGPPAFRAAYDEGCAAGYGYAGSPFHAYEGGARPEPPNTDPQARAGWLSGFHRCRASFERVQRTLHAVLGAP